MAKFKITIGADPEFFIREGRTFIPSTGIIGGSKENPIPIAGLPDGYFMQEDNIMGEFNIPPAASAAELDANIDRALKGINGLLPKKMVLEIQPSAEFKPKFLASKQAKVFGCDPDFNAWTKEQNVFSRSPNPRLRCCGGHVHVGLPDELRGFDAEVDTIRAMDVFLGLPSILLDSDTRRREMYGKAGAFRPKDYGVEYRTISNFWIKTPALRTWVFEATQAAVEAASDPVFMSDINDNGATIVRAINTQDKELATALCNYFNVVY